MVSKTVTTPLEEQLNGSAGMIYMSSNSTNNGDSIITVTFDVGFDQDIGQMDMYVRMFDDLKRGEDEVFNKDA